MNISEKVDNEPRSSGRWSQCIIKNLLLITTLVFVTLGTVGGLLSHTFKNSSSDLIKLFLSRLGVVLRQLHLSEQQILLISYPGELFLRIFKLLMLPLLISSIVTVASDLGGRKTGKIMYRTIIYFLCASMLSATFGILVAYIIKPGHVISSSMGKGVKVAEPKVFDNFLDLGRLVSFSDRNLLLYRVPRFMKLELCTRNNRSKIHRIFL